MGQRYAMPGNLPKRKLKLLVVPKIQILGAKKDNVPRYSGFLLRTQTILCTE